MIVKLNTDKNGNVQGFYTNDVEKAKRLLVPNKEYKVVDMDVGSSSTDIYLEGFDEPFCSSVLEAIDFDMSAQIDKIWEEQEERSKFGW